MWYWWWQQVVIPILLVLFAAGVCYAFVKLIREIMPGKLAVLSLLFIFTMLPVVLVGILASPETLVLSLPPWMVLYACRKANRYVLFLVALICAFSLAFPVTKYGYLSEDGFRFYSDFSTTHFPHDNWSEIVFFLLVMLFAAYLIMPQQRKN